MVEELEALLEVVEELEALEEGVDVLWLELVEEGDVGADAELFVTAGVVGAVWL